MCLGIPAQIVDLDGDHPDLVIADVSGARRSVNMGLLNDESIAVGDWVVIHMGFALEKMTAEEAADALEVLTVLGPGSEDELVFEAEEPPW
ncbi:MAG: HypC/HybG/HupF family hydrogenase formation chaperone [Acidimicrobiia bacterium]